jgi:cell division protein DivIC
MKKILPYLKNKYIIVSAFFFIWMLFVDRNDFIAQSQQVHKLNSLKKEKTYYQGEILKTQQDLTELTTDPEHLEKFAREKYLMKKDNEDIFVIVKEKK